MEADPLMRQLLDEYQIKPDMVQSHRQDDQKTDSPCTIQ